MVDTEISLSLHRGFAVVNITVSVAENNNFVIVKIEICYNPVPN